MTLEETVLAIRLHKLAVALGVFIVSAPAFSHGHHSHGKPLTEVEQKALMVFLMMPMYKTESSVTGMESGNPFILYCKVANLTLYFRRKRMQIKLKHLLKLKIIITKVMQQISR